MGKTKNNVLEKYLSMTVMTAVMQRNDPPVQNDPLVISLCREMTRFILLRSEKKTWGHFSAQNNDPGHPST